MAGPDELLRVARAADGTVSVGRVAPGRGAWLCRSSPACLERALRRGSLSRALRAPVPATVEAELRAAVTAEHLSGQVVLAVCEDGGSHPVARRARSGAPASAGAPPPGGDRRAG